MIFVCSWGPYGPSGRIEAETLDVASKYVHELLEAFGLQIVARHLPPLDETGWTGAVLLAASPVKRYGDMNKLAVSLCEVGQASYWDWQRKQKQATPVAIATPS